MKHSFISGVVVLTVLASCPAWAMGKHKPTDSSSATAPASPMEMTGPEYAPEVATARTQCQKKISEEVMTQALRYLSEVERIEILSKPEEISSSVAYRGTAFHHETPLRDSTYREVDRPINGFDEFHYQLKFQAQRNGAHAELAVQLPFSIRVDSEGTENQREGESDNLGNVITPGGRFFETRTELSSRGGVFEVVNVASGRKILTLDLSSPVFPEDKSNQNGWLQRIARFECGQSWAQEKKLDQLQ